MADQTPPATPPAPTPEPSPLARLAAKYLPWLAAVLVGAVVTYLTGVPVPAPPVPQATAPTPPDLPAFATGWSPDPAAVAAVEATLAQPVFAATPAGQAADPLPPAVYLWDAHRKVTGHVPPVMNQNPVGSCVSFGTSRAVERSLMVQIAKGERFDFRHLVEEAVYAGSRHEIGGDRIRPSRDDPYGDGSVGAWAARWVTTYGALPRGVYGKYDLSKYSPSRCRQWGAVGAGVPDDLEPEVRKYPVGSTTRAASADDVRRAIANGYAAACCSNVGFNKPGTPRGYVDPATRDSRGVCEPNGEWGHCMAVDGYHTDDRGQLYFHIENSWGPAAHGGPVGWGSPNASGFWCRAAVLDSMVRQGDTWIFSAVQGFPVQPVDWFAARPVRRPPLADLALAW